jgi:hypothetical protein
MPCEQGVQIPYVLLINSQVRRLSPKQLAFFAKEAAAPVEHGFRHPFQKAKRMRFVRIGLEGGYA